jgi:hypothetical protein
MIPSSINILYKIRVIEIFLFLYKLKMNEYNIIKVFYLGYVRMLYEKEIKILNWE